MTKVSKITTLVKSLHHLKKKVKDEVDFLHADINIKVFSKLMLSFLMGLANNAQSTQSSYQHLCNILYLYLKKEVKNKVDFLYAGTYQSFHKLILSFLTCMASHIQSTQNTKFVIY